MTENKTPAITGSVVAGTSSLDSAHPLRVYTEWMNLWMQANAMWWDGASSLGGKTYDLGKQFGQYLVNATPEPWRSQLEEQFLHNKDVQEVMRSETMAAWFEQMGQAVKAMGNGHAPSDLFAHYNHQFLTEYSDGSIHPISEQEILKLFPQGNEVEGSATQMPHIIFTSSHARGETLRDVTGITHGIERMVKEATQSKVSIGHVDKGIKPSDTIILYRCEVRENPWLNAAALMRRMHELEHNKTTGTPDSFKEASPGARAIERMMLAAMVQDPSRILKAGDGPINVSDGPIYLREDAARVAQHFMQMGYSKGGNVVSDALRMLVTDLSLRSQKGSPIFFIGQEQEFQPVTNFDVRCLMRQITTWAMGAIEHELSPDMLDLGARRVAFNSTSDSISAHQNYNGGRYDERWMIEGVKQHNGHDPVDALGSRSSSGYAMRDPRIRRRMVELCAPMIGKATISGLRFDSAEPKQLIIETGAGTSDRIFSSHQRTIVGALEKAGMHNISIRSEMPHSGEFTLQLNAPLDSNSFKQLQRAFADMRRGAPGLVIAEDVASQLQQVGTKFGVESNPGKGRGA